MTGFSAGELVTAASLNEHTKFAIERSVYYKPFCHLWRNTDQSIPPSVTTKHDLNTVLENNDGMADVSNGRIVVQTAGRYRVTYGNAWDGNASGARAVFLYTTDSGTPVSSLSIPSTTGFIRLNASWVLYMDAGEGLEIRGNQSSGSSLNARTDYGGCFLIAEWISL
ncbi:hypothetical protein QTQ03_20445 [Micromonospora sp. WMMA1363]|uniref:hypothetical protein n=1 Tax=Micromonospora sp. WMMA1363 TaxID=3053985 RepID=UPI00259CF953|nr:hypothetical protein [Micromonospora sp. WMMA1363]MDM4718450.1 hypothetical protein [Micromonospora sp. WMMA1363]MDM4721849.1 hypothetical protein [Micromonospora sp. WMMA1363]